MSKRIAMGAILVALAMIFSYVELLLPMDFGIPGVKLGLANLVVVMGLYVLEHREVFLICVIRIVLMGLLFGNVLTIVYSLAGAMLSFTVMSLAKRCRGLSIVGVSVAGGVSHNIGQLLVAACIVRNMHVFFYLPPLLIAGTITGALMGSISNRVLQLTGRQIKEYTEDVK